MTGRRAGRSTGWWGPWWGLALLTLGVGIGTAAGTWQLGRATEKRDLEARFAAGEQAGAITRLVEDRDAAAARYRLLRLRGQYDAAHQILLDNISQGGRPGYQVITPFMTADGTVLVNRGWLPADGDRRLLPDVAVGGGTREVLGRLEKLPRPGIELQGTAAPGGAPWPRRMLFPTVQQLRTELGVHVPDYQVLLDPDWEDGYLREWQPGGMPPERHVAYAVQWFGLALTAIVFYMVLVLRNRRQPA